MIRIFSIQLLLLSAILVTACQGDSGPEADTFYTAQKESDLWRVPLLAPYEVVSPNNDTDWFIMLENPDISGPQFFMPGTDFQFTSISRIGIQDSVIVAENTHENWPNLSGAYPSTLIIDARSGKCFMYSREHHTAELSAKLHELNVAQVRMIPWEDIRSDFQQSGKLPEGWKP